MDDMFAQKRLACFNCRSQKLRCSTVLGDTCQRCINKGLVCTRPQSKRERREERARKTAQIQQNPEPYPVTGHPPPPHTTPEPRRSHRSDAIMEAGPEHDLAPMESAEHLFWSARKRKVPFAFGPRLDKSSVLDPIISGIITDVQAENLFNRFHETFGRTLAYFDSSLCTFSHVRHTSNGLLTAICLTIARVEPGLERVSEVLDSHVNHVVLPAILLQDLKSVEIVQALMMLAAFHCPTEDIREDRSWMLLGHAIRIASELNLQGSLFVRCHGQGEAECRRRRNDERTWINLWLHEFSLAQHTGRHSLLADQGLFVACRQWYLEPHACHSDLALVAMVELRTIVLRNRQLYKQLPRESAGYYVEHCKSDLDAWSRAWASASESMPRLELTTLYVNHALVQLLGLALHNTPAVDWKPDIILELYQASRDYLEAFPSLLPAAKLVYCYNSMFVAATYEATVAIRLADLAPKFSFINVEAIHSLCGRVSSCLDEAAAAATTDTAARLYARFLTYILQPPSSKQQSRQLEVPPLTIDSGSSLGFESLEMFAWAGASSAQPDDLLAELLGWQ